MIKCIFKASLLVASAAASLTGVRHGNSSSHSVNQFDLLGNTCPAVSRINEPCPVICVSTLDSCPPALKPSCKAGEFFCRDGKCTAGKSEALACKTARPVCNCEYGFVGEQIGSFYPCLSGQVANVTGLGQGKLGDSPLISKCEGDLSDVLNKQSSFYLQCSTRSNVYLSVFAPEFMAVYCIFSVQVTILIAYTFFRQLKSKSSSFQQVELVGSKGKSDLSFSGFHKSTIGALVKRSIYLTSFMWIFLVAVLIADYYRVFSNFSYREYSQIFIDHDNLSRVFIALWHIMGCWFLVLQVSSGWLETYFLYPAASQVIPDYILVKKRQLDTIEYTNLGGIVQWIHKIEAPFRRFTSTDCTQTLVAVEWTEKQRAYIDFECVRYVYDHGAGSFQPFEFPIGSTLAQLHDGATGLSESEAQRRFHLNGPNQILFKADEFGDAVFKEFSGIFYLYQFMMLVIWAYYAYYYMALLLSVVIIGSGMVKVSVATEGQKRVVAMATYFNIVRVFRDGYWASLDSRCLVPGDLIEIIASQEHALSVDCVLLTGDAVVDESALTGEALPVAKTCVKNEAGPFRTEDHGKRHCLFAGCHVLEAQSAKRVTALVLATGAESVKGTLVRDILYPVPILFVFIEQLKVVFPILLLWGIIMLFASVAMLGVESIDSWFYGMFTISQVLSPLLPAVLVVGQSISAQRLAMKKISCTDFSRITLAGKVKVFCFDKTGTLTKEGLEFIGCNPVSSANLFSEKAIQQTVVEMSPEIKIAMHICHSLATVSGQIVGNFVDVEMFKATRATLDVANQALIYPEAKSKLNTLKIVKRYEFIHSEAYMTVVAQDVVTGRFYCVMKGSFEKLCKCCINCPKDLAQTADSHAKRGCYIVALAYHAFSAQITMEQINEMTREQTQGQSRIVGLMMFRNELKGTTRDAIDHLREGGCRPVMVTGDNAVTAIHVGHECHMFARHVNPINIILIDAAEKVYLAYVANYMH